MINKRGMEPVWPLRVFLMYTGGDMKTTAILTTSSRSRRITWGFGLSIAIGLIGLPLTALAVWPGADHSPWAANTVVLALGVLLSTVSYIFGRIAVAAVTEGRRNAVAPP